MIMSDQNNEHNDRPSGYEKKDANVRFIAIVALVLIVVIAGIGVMLNELFLITTEDAIQDAVLSVDSEELAKLRAHEDSLLSSYELLDTSSGVWRIPIDSAIEIVAGENNSK